VLERDGLVERTVLPSVPPQVEYALTDLGRELLRPVSALAEWAAADDGDGLEARAESSNIYVRIGIRYTSV
jgi:DNA-binding HxlR family transcriptional regulator